MDRPRLGPERDDWQEEKGTAFAIQEVRCERGHTVLVTLHRMRGKSHAILSPGLIAVCTTGTLLSQLTNRVERAGRCLARREVHRVCRQVRDAEPQLA